MFEDCPKIVWLVPRAKPMLFKIACFSHSCSFEWARPRSAQIFPPLFLLEFFILPVRAALASFDRNLGATFYNYEIVISILPIVLSNTIPLLAVRREWVGPNFIGCPYRWAGFSGGWKSLPLRLAPHRQPLAHFGGDRRGNYEFNLLWAQDSVPLAIFCSGGNEELGDRWFLHIRSCTSCR